MRRLVHILTSKTFSATQPSGKEAKDSDSNPCPCKNSAPSSDPLTPRSGCLAGSRPPYGPALLVFSGEGLFRDCIPALQLRSRLLRAFVWVVPGLEGPFLCCLCSRMGMPGLVGAERDAGADSEA
ncbi:hypothetical protein AAFF_G00422250 [Aldrovandia affinis]|uniref:Uncharacterized protein n=1 Tax=Aldrovandia affinis TaxID=143900 RepID=A0AAD7R3B8_9TELE|nr:hypothetical protein AAFF_G00422250 [Aldrovandia affinis]